MSHRSDVANGRLVYSCNCGWIDVIHAGLGVYARADDPEIGQRNLWRQLVDESWKAPLGLGKQPAFLVHYRQFMRKWLVTAGHRASYLVRSGLPLERKKAIGLRILLDASAKFERLQAGIPFGLISDSGFSGEDLVSNAIGYYRVVHNMSDGAVHAACKTVTKAASLAIWDAYLRDGIGSHKSHSFSAPRYYKCDECHERPAFPALFCGVKPADYGFDFAPFPQESRTVPFELAL
jgi:hypothetical protein